MCTRFCLQHEVMKAYDCYHTQLEMSLMNVSKFAYDSAEGRKPCDITYENRAGETSL